MSARRLHLRGAPVEAGPLAQALCGLLGVDVVEPEAFVAAGPRRCGLCARRARSARERTRRAPPPAPPRAGWLAAACARHRAELDRALEALPTVGPDEWRDVRGLGPEDLPQRGTATRNYLEQLEEDERRRLASPTPLRRPMSDGPERPRWRTVDAALAEWRAYRLDGAPGGVSLGDGDTIQVSPDAVFEKASHRIADVAPAVEEALVRAYVGRPPYVALDVGVDVLLARLLGEVQGRRVPEPVASEVLEERHRLTAGEVRSIVRAGRLALYAVLGGRGLLSLAEAGPRHRLAAEDYRAELAARRRTGT